MVRVHVRAHVCVFSFSPHLHLLISPQDCWPPAFSISGNQRINNNSTVNYCTRIVLSVSNLISPFLLSPKSIRPSVVYFLPPLHIPVTPHGPRKTLVSKQGRATTLRLPSHPPPAAPIASFSGLQAQYLPLPLLQIQSECHQSNFSWSHYLKVFPQLTLSHATS